ncbi:MAG: hypothetical protein E6J41_16490 [Chloroflexi bacterium]|nr:MAG: hypothetical protein E6J41_16490 [Chloroflexota bacterium]
MWIAVLAAALAVAGCGGAAAGGASSAPAVVRVADADNGRTVTLTTGGRLALALGSTYWNVAGSSNAAVLRQDGQPVVSPGSCPPGVGCGQVSATFTAVGPGRADVTASRSSCGEALSCTGGAGRYRVTVVVSGP